MSKENTKAAAAPRVLAHIHSGPQALPWASHPWKVECSYEAKERDDIQDSLGLPEGTRAGLASQASRGYVSPK